MGRLPEAWIAPPATRELRGWVRHRAKLVGLRSSLKCQVHAVLAGAGIAVPMSDLFGVAGRQLLGPAAAVGGGRGPGSTRCARLITALDFEIDLFTKLVAGPAAHRPRLPGDPGHPRGRAGAGRGVRRRDRRHHPLPRPEQLASWAGLTPKHHESDTTVHRGRITKQGCRLVRWAAVEAVQRVPAPTPASGSTGTGSRTPRPQHRRRGRRPGPDHAGVLRRCVITTSAACPPAASAA